MARPTIDSIRALNRRIADLDAEIDQLDAELGMARHLDDDARRDALVTGSFEDRRDARRTARDVRRLARLIEKLDVERQRVVVKRDRAVERLSEM
ncbi:MAG: hypothetical protein KDB69_00930 [Acidimicrobiia bacterium]|nr:hypothetical protein [Acidimicrobiia bacterium]